MALVPNTKGNVKFLKIADHQLCLKEKVENADSISAEDLAQGWEYLKTTDSSGKEYHNKVLKFKKVFGYLTGIEYAKRTLPGSTIEVASWRLEMEDGDEEYSLDIPANSPAASRFVKLAENIDPAQPIEIAAWKDTSDAKPKQAFMVKQSGSNIPQKYSVREIEVTEAGKDGTPKAIKVTALVDYDNPENPDAPRLKVLRNGDKDWSAIEDFLFERMEIVMDRFKTQKAESPLAVVEAGSEVEDDESIPF